MFFYREGSKFGAMSKRGCRVAESEVEEAYVLGGVRQILPCPGETKPHVACGGDGAIGRDKPPGERLRTRALTA